MKNILPVFLLGASCAASAAAYACSCAPPPEPKIALEKSAAVFVGRFTSSEKVPTGNKYQFAVSKKWKGVAGKTVSIVSGESSAACGINFDSNRDYLVYAFKNEGDDQLRTNLCTRTKRTEGAEAEFAELGAPQTDVMAYPVSDNGEIQLDVTRNLGSTLSNALKADGKSQLFRLNWNDNAGRGTALYNRANSTFKVYSRLQTNSKVEIRSTLYSGVTDDILKQAASSLYDGKSSLPSGVTKKDLGSKII